ncbi:MAG: helix-turn-helix domain-containing protein [Chloroflexota bacterium]
MDSDAVLATVRQEVATLREVFVAIQDALVAALARLESLEEQLTITERPAQGDGDDASRGIPPLRARPPVAAWKLPGWLPATRTAGLAGVAGASRAGGDGAVTGETLRARREALGISQAAVAHAAHCSRGLVAEVERGKRRSAQTLAHLAAVLDRLEHQARRN